MYRTSSHDRHVWRMEFRSEYASMLLGCPEGWGLGEMRYGSWDWGWDWDPSSPSSIV